MNDSTPLPPLPPDQVDELLSADLDGDFDAAASELGLTPADARTRLAATAGSEARRDLLAAARDALAQPPPADELLEARMRSAAIAAAHDERDARTAAQRRHRLWYSAAGIAAVLVGAIALVGVLSHRADTTKSSSSSAGAPTAPTAPTAPAAGSLQAVAFGSFPDVHALDLQLRTTPLPAADRQRSELSAGSSPTVYAQAQTPAVPPAEKGAVAADCAAAADRYAGASDLVLAGTATVAGKPVDVRFYAKGGAHVVVVLGADCSLLDKRLLP